MTIYFQYKVKILTDKTGEIKKITAKYFDCIQGKEFILYPGSDDHSYILNDLYKHAQYKNFKIEFIKTA